MSAPVLGDTRLRRLLEAGRPLLANLELDSVLDELLEIAREVTGARYAAAGVLDAERRELERFVTRGIDPATQRGIGDLPRGRGVLGVLIEDPRPLRIHRVGDHRRSYGFPAGHPPMETFLGVPILIRGEPWGNLYLTEKAGGEDFSDADEEAAVILADWAAIAIDNARAYERAERDRRSLERAVQGLEATTAIARAIGTETRLDPVLELVVKRGRALVGARSMLIFLVEDGDLVLAACAGEASHDQLGRRYPLRDLASERALETGELLHIHDVAGHIARLEQTTRRSFDPGEFTATPVSGALIAPLVYRGRGVGVLSALGCEDGERFGNEEAELLRGFASSAAVAVATAKTVAEERLRHSLRSAEDERRRWARELHDETLQGLGALRIGLGAALRGGGTAELQTAVGQALEQLETEIANLRSLLSDLRPAALDELGLTPALEALAERMRTRAGVELVLELELAAGDGNAAARLEEDIETAVYRTAQEALTNVAKHSGAQRVHLTVRQSPEEIAVEVADDGRGFEVGGDHAGFGLVGMRERVELAGGTLHVASSGAGTTIRAALPVRRRRRHVGTAA